MNLEYLRAKPRAEADAAGTTPAMPLPTAGAERARPRHLGRIVRGTAKLLLPLIALAVGFAGFQYLKATKPETPKRPKQERTYNVTTFKAQPGDVRPRLTLYGTTVAGRQVEIRARVAGPVIETSPALVEGGLIAKGETLLAIDPFDYRNALAESKAQLAETRARITELEASIASETVSLGHARAQLKLAIEDLERAEPLAKRGAVTERTVDERQQVVLQRRQAADQLANSIAVWEARVAQSRAGAERLEAAIARAERRVEETRLEAPFNAYVAEVTTQVGRMIGANDKVATLIDRDWIEVRFALTDAQYGRMVAGEGALVGRKVDVEWTLGGNSFAYTARIERIGARVTSEAGGVEVLARIDNPAQPIQLRPGAFVTATLDDVLYRGVVRLPGSSLYDRDTVYVVENGRLAARKVRLVGAAGSEILVEGDLKPGEVVLETRIATPGTGVAVKEAAAP
ncbi:MAG: efflux RND transporter periplasmic adaptor subunit [Pseudomonadota bacterium]